MGNSDSVAAITLNGGNDNHGFHFYTTASEGDLAIKREVSGTQTEVMRIQRSDGSLLIGTTNTNPVANNVAGMLYQGSSGAGQFSRPDNPALFLNRGNNGMIQQFYRGVAVGFISVTTTATSYSTTSDYRLKENVTDITDGITRVKQLDPKRFNFIAEPDTTVELAHKLRHRSRSYFWRKRCYRADWECYRCGWQYHRNRRCRARRFGNWTLGQQGRKLFTKARPSQASAVAYSCIAGGYSRNRNFKN